MGVYNKKTSAVLTGKGRRSTPIDGRELRRWMERQVNSSTNVTELVNAAGVEFGFKPTSWLIEIAQKAIFKSSFRQ